MKTNRYNAEYQKKYREENKSKLEQFRKIYSDKKRLQLQTERLREMEGIEWFDMIPYPNDFIISKCGQIRNKRTLKLKAKRLDRNGYEICTIYGETKIVHRLLALTFITNPKPDIYKEINHINGIKNDNRLENLEWTSRSENMKHAFENGFWKSNLIDWHKRKKEKSNSGEF